jgi:hypothetical protein
MRSCVCECPRRKCTCESGIVCLYFSLHPLEREGVALISTLRYLTTSKPSTVNCAALQLFCHQQRAHRRRAGLAQGCGRARTHGYSSSFRDPGGRQERKGRERARGGEFHLLCCLCLLRQPRLLPLEPVKLCNAILEAEPPPPPEV